MEITTRDYKRVSVIRVTGRIDSTTAPQFEGKLNDHIKNGHIHLVLEMDGADYLSSAGVRTLISTQKTLKGKGGEVTLAQPSPRVKEVLEACRTRTALSHLRQNRSGCWRSLNTLSH